MAVAPAEMQSIIADHINRQRFKIAGNAAGIDQALVRPLIDASRAAARQAQIASIITAGMAVAPLNLDLWAGGFNFFGNGFHFKIPFRARV